MLCTDCTAPIPSGDRCVYCAARRRASVTRKAGGAIFAASITAMWLIIALHVHTTLDALLGLPALAGIAVYIVGVVRWLRAPKRPFIEPHPGSSVPSVTRSQDR